MPKSAQDHLPSSAARRNSEVLFLVRANVRLQASDAFLARRCRASLDLFLLRLFLLSIASLLALGHSVSPGLIAADVFGGIEPRDGSKTWGVMDRADRANADSFSVDCACYVVRLRSDS